MKYFLQEVAERIGKQYGKDMSRVAVVFNNRRPFQFLKKELSGIVGVPFFPPAMLSMDDLVRQISGREIVQKEFLLFDLYDVYRHCEAYKSRQESFEDFISIGEMMLSDFSEIDLYCVDAQQLFSNLDDAKKIEAWGKTFGSDKPQPSEFVDNYLKFYRSLLGVYNAFREYLDKDNRAYSGMAYRNAADKIDSMIDSIRYEHIFFVGFNALSESEQRIVRAFVKAGRASIIADGDDFYFSDKDQEAGHFLRMMHSKFRDAGFFPVHDDRFDSHFSDGEKKIRVVACPENVLQAKYVGYRIGELISEPCDDKEEHLQNTAIVLADEKMLVPVLNSLPEGITANITMGFPFAHSMVCNFVLKLLELHRNRHGDRFYHKDVVSVLSDTYVCRMAGYSVKPSQVVRWLNEHHFTYSSLSDIEAFIVENDKKGQADIDVVRMIFSNDAASANGMIDLWGKCIDAIEQHNILETNPKENEALKGMRTVVRHFVELQQRFGFVEKLDTLRKIYDRFVRRLSVSLIGQPLQGLQLTGMLEARNLDFDRIILVSAGEGVLPAGMTANSLIPYDLKGGVLGGYNPHTGDYGKRGFGMPTYNDRDAVYANHFYSLIQRASVIDLVYCTDPDAAGKGEPSRFVMQVRDELAPRYNINVETINVIAPHGQAELRYTVGEKSDKVMQRLREMVDGETIEKGDSKTVRALSPSALNTFNDCSMRFYYERVLHMREQDTLAEDAEASDLGTCVHAVLEDIFRPKNGPLIITKELIADALSTVDKRIENWFIDSYGEEGIKTGRNYMMLQVAKRQARNYLEYEQKQLQNGISTTIISVESEDLVASIDVLLSNGETVTAHIAGRADRIDTVTTPDGTLLRIVDYKTGSVEEKDLGFKSDKPDNVPGKWFQVMCYAWLYKQNHPGSNEQMMSGIMPLRNAEIQFKEAKTDGASLIDDNALRQFEEVLITRLTKILDPSEPFVPRPVSDRSTSQHGKCTYCPILPFCLLQPEPSDSGTSI
ncbi:MAG: PD-(D/E)XK nuclease family protein [Bacteroidales bacterium]|nr:PD-(D/E)XK nuclease family protein [Bacteroidales bacterium]